MVDFLGLGPGDRVKKARSLTGIKYKQETDYGKRTSNTKEALEYMDCSELVCRVLAADEITDQVQHKNTDELYTYLENDKQFTNSKTPQVGDIALWDGHVGIVTSVDGDKIRLTHARGTGKLSKENTYHILPSVYRSSEFYGYYRPIEETNDGKIDENGNPIVAEELLPNTNPISILEIYKQLEKSNPFEEGEISPNNVSITISGALENLNTDRTDSDD
jgi:surface antigen